MDRKVDFVCCDNPTAKFTIHIPAMAEHERDGILARTKAALAAKANGKKLGNYQRTPRRAR